MIITKWELYSLCSQDISYKYENKDYQIIDIFIFFIKFSSKKINQITKHQHAEKPAC